MALSALPDTPAIIGRIRWAIDATWAEWDFERKREGGRDRSPTSELKLRLWEMGFDYRLVYPKANQLGDGAQDAATRRLTERGVPTESGLHARFTMSEFLYDVAWMEYHEELAEERTFPPFKRTVLALESELGHERAVLYDFDKLLAARAELRVMVWQSRQSKSKYPQGMDELPVRLGAAGEAGQGWWLLSAWGDDAPEHRVYNNGERIKELERAPEHARER